jgi:nucleoside-diphosphate-sugar epimerase
MDNLRANSKILVTGGSGYLASWVVRQLLDEGHSVNTTVRSLADSVRVSHLSDMEKEFPGKLRIFEADLTKAGSFDQPAAGCEVVIHTASPFKISGIRDAMKELVEPAVMGVRNVFGAAVRSGTVRRMILTSSVAAVFGDAADLKHNPKGIFNEDDWNTTSSARHQPYAWSKTLAEQEAWKIAGEHPHLELNVINPGFILGPSLSKRKDSVSISVIDQFVSGKFRTGVPKGMHAVVDVRDVAEAHLLAAYSPVSGMRFIAAPHHTTFVEMATIVKRNFPDLPVPSHAIPTWLFLLVGPFLGFPARFILRNIGYVIRIDNTRIQKVLGIKFRPLDETLTDQVRQILSQKGKRI